MKLITQIPLQKQSDKQIDYSSKIVLLGSCFTENIGDKLSYYKFQNTINPFGILFHPEAISTLVENALSNKNYQESEVFFNNEQWHCFDAHSKLSNVSKEQILKDLNLKLKATNTAIKTASHVVITLGTSWVYRYKKQNKVVANCHKVNANEFEKKLLSVAEIISSLQKMETLIKAENPNATLIFTVSPVRHIKDGFVENTQSKSHLITAIHQFLEANVATKNYCSVYFPSYEIMMDELRDYRFYKPDMMHPNETAINYIWEKFHQVWMSKNTINIMQAVDAIQKGLMHRPFNDKSEKHQKFLEQLAIKKQVLQLQFPHIQF